MFNPYISINVCVHISVMMLHDVNVKPQLVKTLLEAKLSKPHMPMLITKLQYKPMSFSTADYL